MGKKKKNKGGSSSPATPAKPAQSLSNSANSTAEEIEESPSTPSPSTENSIATNTSTVDSKEVSISSTTDTLDVKQTDRLEQTVVNTETTKTTTTTTMEVVASSSTTTTETTAATATTEKPAEQPTTAASGTGIRKFAERKQASSRKSYNELVKEKQSQTETESNASSASSDDIVVKSDVKEAEPPQFMSYFNKSAESTPAPAETKAAPVATTTTAPATPKKEEKAEVPQSPASEKSNSSVPGTPTTPSTTPSREEKFLTQSLKRTDSGVLQPKKIRITDDELNLCRKLFNECDEDGSSAIDNSELKQLFAKLGLTQYSDEEIQSVFNTMDNNRDGRVNFKEFINGSPDYLMEAVREKAAEPLRRQQFSLKRSTSTEPKSPAKKETKPVEVKPVEKPVEVPAPAPEPQIPEAQPLSIDDDAEESLVAPKGVHSEAGQLPVFIEDVGSITMAPLSTIHVGEPVEAVFSMKNPEGQATPVEKSRLKIEIKTGSGSVSHNFESKEDKVYVKFVPVSSEHHTVNFCIDGAPHKDMFKMVCYNKIDLTKTTLEGPELKSGAVQSDKVKLTIFPRNVKGEVVTVEDKFQIKVTEGSSPLAFEKSVNTNDTIDITFTPNNVGKVGIEVLYGDKSISGSPYTVNVDSIVDISKTTVQGKGVGAQAKEGEEVEFVIDAKDRKGNPVSGSTPFTVSVKNKDADLKVTSVGEKNGSHIYKYTAAYPGPITVATSLHGKALQGSPFKVDVAVKVDASKSTASGKGATEPLKESEDATVIVKLNDARGSPVSGIAALLAVSVKDGSGAIKSDVKELKNGEYEVKFKGGKEGETLAVEIKADGQPIKGSPFSTVVQTSVDASKCEVKGLDATFREGVAAKFDLLVKNSESKGATTAAKHSQIAITDASKKEVATKVEDKGDGTLSVNFTPADEGEHVIQISVNKETIRGSPFKIQVQPAVDVSKTTVEGKGVQAGQEDQASTFTVAVKTKKGNAFALPRNDLIVDIKDPAAKSVSAEVAENGVGQFSVKYTPIVNGVHAVNVSVAGTPVKGSPFKVDVKSTAVASTSSAAGSGITAPLKENEDSTITIKLNDKRGNPVAGVPSDIAVSIKDGANPVQHQLKEKGNGEYEVKFTNGKESASLTFDIQVNGSPLKGSPFSGTVKSSIDVSKCSVDGLSAEFKEQSPISFTVHVNDSNSKPVANAVEKIKVTVLDAKKAEIKCTAKSTSVGDVQYSFTPSDAGELSVNIVVNDVPLKGSPFAVKVSPIADAASSVVSGKGVESAKEDQETEFTVVIKDKRGANLSVPLSDVKVDIQDSAKQAVKAVVTEKGNGEFLVKYKPDLSGEHTISAAIGGVAIKGTPCKVSVASTVVASMSTASGKGVTEPIKEQEEAKVTVSCKDKRGNPVSGVGSLITASVSSNGAPVTTSAVTEKGSGNYEFSFNASKESKNLSVDIKVDGKPIKGSPFATAVNSLVDISKCSVEGLNQQFYEGVESQIKILVKDSDSKAVQKASERTTIALSDASKKDIKVAASEKNAGEIVVSFTPTDKGDHLLSIAVGGVSLQNSPFKLPVLPSVDFATSEASGKGLSSAVEDKEADFVVSIKDKRGEGVAINRDALLVEIKDPANKAVAATVSDSGNGQFAVRYVPTIDGQHVVTVSVSNKAIKSSPFKINVQNVPSAANCSAKGKGVTEPLKELEEAKIRIVCKDKRGQPAITNTQVTASVKDGSSAVKTHLLELGNGEFQLAFTAEKESDNLVVDIQVNGQPIPGSPFTSSVASRIDPSKCRVEGLQNSAPEGQPVSFKVILQDSNENPVPDTTKLKVSIIDAQGNAITPQMLVDEQQAIQVSYTPSTVGDFKLHVEIPGKTLDQTQTIQAVADASQSRLTGPANSQEGQETICTVSIKDKRGNGVSVPITDLRVEVTDPANDPIKISLTEKETGEYVLKFIPQAHGTHTVTATLFGTAIQGSPLKIDVSRTIIESIETPKPVPVVAHHEPQDSFAMWGWLLALIVAGGYSYYKFKQRM